MDKEVVHDNMLETAIGYTGSVGASLWVEVQQNQALVCPGYGVVIVGWLTMV
jgi:hypothetical protein